MPTGYTAQIEDGKVNTFPEFAKLCIRAFGSAVHMREEPLDKPYVPSEPSSYHTDKIREINGLLEEVKKVPSSRLVEAKKKDLNKQIAQHEDSIDRKKKHKVKVEKMMKDAKAWTPPTDDHKNFKKFVIEQLTIALESDCDYSYYEDQIKRYNDQLKDLNGEAIRKERIQHLEGDILYHQTKHDEDVKRCNERNEWAKQLFESIGEKV